MPFALFVSGVVDGLTGFLEAPASADTEKLIARGDSASWTRRERPLRPLLRVPAGGLSQAPHWPAEVLLHIVSHGACADGHDEVDALALEAGDDLGGDRVADRTVVGI